MKTVHLPSFRATTFLLVLSTVLIGGCATTTTETSNPPAAQSAERAEWAIEPWDGYGLDIPLDGTSMMAWERSLVSVKAYSEPEDYELLLSAIEYLRVYDLAARGKMEILITRLNGLTGYEILSRVNWRKPAPGKGPAEKGSRDASLINRG